jgi:AcrR family transcriptional regulator
MSRMRKGDTTRQAIVDHAVDLARRVGLEGLTIGRLAEDLALSKSGLFAHFQSKEALQVQVLEAAAGRFVDIVVRPVLASPRGEPRVRLLFDRWLDWEGRRQTPGGCLFVHAAAELDERDGPARDRLVSLQRDWLESIATVARGAVREGHFRADLDPDQFAQEFNGVMLAYHQAARLLRDPEAEPRARRAFERLLVAARAVASDAPPASAPEPPRASAPGSPRATRRSSRRRQPDRRPPRRPR